jgi:tetratricopeptide (TPR) repeat protein
MLALILALGCEREPPVDPEPAGSVDPDAEPAGQPTTQPEAPDPYAPRERPEPTAVHSRPEALSALSHGNPEGAAEFLKTALDENPDDLELRLALSTAQWRVGAYDAAEALLSAQVLADVGVTDVDARVRALIRRSEYRWRRGDLDASADRLDEAAALDPDHLGVKGRALGRAIARGGAANGTRADPALAALMESLYDAYQYGTAKSAEDMLAVGLAAIARGSAGGFKDANMVLHEAEELAPADGTGGLWLGDEVHLLHAAIFAEKYAAADAEETLQLILARDPWHPDALAALGDVYVGQLRLGDAERSAKEALLVNPRHVDAHAVLARVELVEGRRAQARQRIETEILPRDPHHPVGLAVAAALAIFEDDATLRDRAMKAAAAANPGNPRFFAALADILGFLHLYREIDEVLEAAVKIDPENPYVQSAFGLNRLRLGDETVGREAIEIAWKGDRFNERTLNTRNLYRDRIEPHFTELSRGPITLRLSKQSAEMLGPLLLDEMVEARKTLDRHYHHDPGSTRFEIFETQEDFAIRTVGVPELGAVGVCFGPMITAIGPYQGFHNFPMVLWHELGHVYAIELSRGRVPRWFTEGLSEWEASQADPSWTRRSGKLLRLAREHGKIRPLHELELAFLRAGSAMGMEAAYMTAAMAMRYLGETYGREAMANMLRSYGEGKTTDEAMRAHLNKSLSQVEAEFSAWFDAELDRLVSGWSPDPQRVGDPKDAMFLEATKLYQAGKIKEASRELEALIAAGGDGFEARVGLAHALVDTGAASSAITHLEKAGQFDMESTEPKQMLAKLARARGDAEAEKRHSLAVLALDPVAFDTTRALLATALATGDEQRRRRAQRRCDAVAPLHAACMAGRAADSKRPTKLRRAALDAAAAALSAGEGDAPTRVVAVLAARALGADASANSLSAGFSAALPPTWQQAIER